MYHPPLSPRALRLKTHTALAHITLNRYTTFFFLVSFLYCLAQGLLQSVLFSLDSEYSALVDGLVRAGSIPAKNTTFLEGPRGGLVLQMCNDIPHGQVPEPCFVLFDESAPPGVDAPLQTRGLEGWEAGMVITPLQDGGAQIQVGSSGAVPIQLSEECLQTLVYPSQVLHNMRREDITFVVLQFWLLVVSFFAILNDSVPHVLTVLMTRTITTAWAAYALWRGPAFQDNFDALVARPGTPCALGLFDGSGGSSGFWERRGPFEIADLVLSSTGLVFFCYLSWTLLKIYNAQCFKCVGAPEHVMRIHKFFMALLACLQMETFVLAAGMGLWINVLMTTAMLHISDHTKLYEALYITTIILLLPWISMGWYSIRRERKKMMVGFLAIAFVIMAGWATLFDSIVFRWVFVQWPYLGCWTVASFMLLFASIALGVVCRINFGKGLAEYLHAESTLAKLNFAPDAFDVKAEDGPSRSNSMRKDTLDFKDVELGDEDFMSAAPMYFVSSEPLTQPDPMRDEKGTSIPDIVVTTPYASERALSSLNVHPDLGTLSSGTTTPAPSTTTTTTATTTTTTTTTTSSPSPDERWLNSDVESGRVVPVRPRRRDDDTELFEDRRWDAQAQALRTPKPRF